MSWIGGTLFRHYSNRREMRHLAMEPAAPPLEHPCLGLGGRSIELSLGEGVEPSIEAFLLAADELLAHVEAADWPTEDLLRGAEWLAQLWPAGREPNAQQRLAADFDALRE